MPKGEEVSLTVITGPMLAWKTSELIRRVQRAKFAKKRVVAFKPAIDDRYHTTQITTHDGSAIDAIAVHSLVKNFSTLGPWDGVAVDEIQFFEDLPDMLDLVAMIARQVEVVMCGLDMDFKGEPFPATAGVMAIADRVFKLTSICAKCGSDAIHTQRVLDGKEVTSGDTVQVGGVDIYEPRCRRCFVTRSNA